MGSFEESIVSNNFVVALVEPLGGYGTSVVVLVSERVALARVIDDLI